MTAELSKNTKKPGTRIALVTGGSRGLGRSTVLNLAKRGVDSIFTYHTNRAEAEKVAGLVRETGARLSSCSLTRVMYLRSMRLCRTYGGALTDLGAERFDYLVNMAGISHHNSLLKRLNRSWITSTTSISRGFSS